MPAFYKHRIWFEAVYGLKVIHQVPCPHANIGSSINTASPLFNITVCYLSKRSLTIALVFKKCWFGVYAFVCYPEVSACRVHYSSHSLHAQSGQSLHSVQDFLQCCSHPHFSQMYLIIFKMPSLGICHSHSDHTSHSWNRAHRSVDRSCTCGIFFFVLPLQFLEFLQYVSVGQFGL